MGGLSALETRAGHTEEARTGLRSPCRPPKAPHSAGRSRGGRPGARMGAQSLEPLGLPPATDAPQVIVRESFTPSPSGFTPVTRTAPQCPWRPRPSQSTNLRPQAALIPRLGDPSGVSLVSASPELEGGTGRIVGTSWPASLQRHTVGPVH